MAPTAHEVAKLLVDRGFEVYQTVGDRVDLAERVRDNLMMDANVSISVDRGIRVRFSTRAQRCDFPSSRETAEVLFDRARALVAADAAGGFVEVDTEVVHLTDPSDASKVLDTWYQVVFEREASGFEELVVVVRDAMAAEKVVPR